MSFDCNKAPTKRGKVLYPLGGFSGLPLLALVHVGLSVHVLHDGGDKARAGTDDLTVTPHKVLTHHLYATWWRERDMVHTENST